MISSSALPSLPGNPRPRQESYHDACLPRSDRHLLGSAPAGLSWPPDEKGHEVGVLAVRGPARPPCAHIAATCAQCRRLRSSRRGQASVFSAMHAAAQPAPRRRPNNFFLQPNVPQPNAPPVCAKRAQSRPQGRTTPAGWAPAPTADRGHRRTPRPETSWGPEAGGNLMDTSRRRQVGAKRQSRNVRATLLPAECSHWWASLSRTHRHSGQRPGRQSWAPHVCESSRNERASGCR